MQILYLSHCVPNPPDKGEKIRAYHVLKHLARTHAVHVVCFARSQEEEAGARELARTSASVYVERFSPTVALARAAARFGIGGCLTLSYYQSARMRAYVESLPRPEATVAYSTAMAQYAPEGVPLLLDMTDVDSEKWFGYGRTRRLGWVYAMEGRRLQRHEVEYARRAKMTTVVTESEAALLRSIVPDAMVRCSENGVDCDTFDPKQTPRLPELDGRRFLVFLGAMGYHPNIDAVCWFSREVFPELRRQDPSLEFLIVGRDPARPVRRLAGQAGVSVVGTVPDVRPYLAGSLAVVAPLRIARGVQNKVLEALAMGKRVMASAAVCETFGGDLPEGLVRCETTADYAGYVGASAAARIRRRASVQFRWERSLETISLELSKICEGSGRESENAAFCRHS
jgi:sugar transferase (PEP-CTERM/EpsH1 system associated)